MNVAVKFWKDNPEKPLDFPGEFPWECREIGDATEYTKEPGQWTIMPVDRFNAYVEEVTPLKTEWDNAPDTIGYKLRVLWNKWFR